MKFSSRKFFADEFFFKRDSIAIFRLVTLSRILIIGAILLSIYPLLQYQTLRETGVFFLIFIGISILSLHFYDKFKNNDLAHEYIVFSLFMDYIIITTTVFLTGGIFSDFLYLYFFILFEAFGFFAYEGVIFFTSLVIVSVFAISILNYFGINTPYKGFISPEDLKKLRSLQINVIVTLKVLFFMVVGALLTYASRFLERSKIEAQEAKAEAAQAKVDLKNIVDSLNSGLIVFDPRKNILYLNNSAKTILGIGDIPPTNLDEFKMLRPDFAERLEEALKHLDTIDREEITIKCENRVKPIGISLSYVWDEFKEDIKYVIVVFQDITEVKEMERRLRVKDRYSAIGEFTAQIGHEIRIPLNSLSVALGKAQEIFSRNNIKLTPHEKEIFEVAEDDITRITNFVDTLQMFTNTGDFKPTIFPIGKEFSAVAQIAAQAIANVEAVNYIISNIANPDVLVEFSKSNLEQVLLNLVRNAYEAIISSEKKKGFISIVLADGTKPYIIFNKTKFATPLEIDEDRVAIIVEDTGPGISREAIDKVFFPFFTTKKEGTGIGLSIVKRLVELNGGELKLYSHEGVGTAFVILLNKYRGKGHGKGKNTLS